MKHARPDYDERIQDSAGLIPDDEPVLLIRGQDGLALAIIGEYIDRYSRAADGDPRVLEFLQEHTKRIAAWQAEHGSKVADLPENIKEHHT